MSNFDERLRADLDQMHDAIPQPDHDLVGPALARWRGRSTRRAKQIVTAVAIVAAIGGATVMARMPSPFRVVPPATHSATPAEVRQGPGAPADTTTPRPVVRPLPI